MKQIVVTCLAAALLSVPGLASASDKPACEMQLAEVSIQNRNLDEHRDATEKALAKEQMRSYVLSQRIATLEKQLADLKKAMEPKVEEKPKE